MKQKTEEEDFIVRYLFGELSEEEENGVEERFLSDNQFFEQMLSVEDALIDAYAQEELSKNERRKVEEFLLTSQHQVGQLAFVRGLIGRLAAMNPGFQDSMLPSLEPRPLSWQSWLASLTKRGLGKKLSFAFLVLGMIFSLFLIIWNVRLQNKLAQLEVRQAELGVRDQQLSQQIEKQGDQNNELAKGLEEQRAGRDELERDVTALQDSNSANYPGQIATLHLTTDLFSRGDSELKVVHIRQNVRRLRINIDLDAEPTYAEYGAAIKTFEGREIWRAKDLRPEPHALNRLALSIPANFFANDYYTLTLTAKSENAGTVEIGDYSFRIKK